MELFARHRYPLSAGRLTEPGPSAGAIERLLQAAARAPDHGRLKPWRFIVLDGAAREAFAAAAAAAKRRALARHDRRTDGRGARENAPLARIVVVGCAVQPQQTKVPEIEQVVAVGAAARIYFWRPMIWASASCGRRAPRPTIRRSRRRRPASPTTTSWPSCIWERG